HVVNGMCLHQRWHCAIGHLVHRAGQLRVHSRDAPLLVFAHLEAHGYHGIAVSGAGVYVIHARKLEHALLHGARQQVLCLTRTHAGHGDHHVYHGNRDLWLFLARGAHQPDCSYRKRRERHQRREPRADESLCYSSCDAHLQFLSLLEVADAAAPVGTITSSPARSPAVTSTRSPDDAPRRTQRSSSPFGVRSVTPVRSPWRMTAFTGTTSALREPAGNSSVAALPARKSRVEAPVTGFGTSAFTRYRFPPSAGTTPSTVACTLRPSIRVVIDCPRLTPRTAPGAAVADMRSC